MFTTQSNSWVQSVSWPRDRKPFRIPQRQIALRKEHIATTDTHLLLKPQGGAQSAVRFKIIDDYNDSTKFTVTGKKYSDRSCREIRDSSGLPLFEIHEKARFAHKWFVTLPGSNEATVANAAVKYSLKYGINDFGMSFENQAALETKDQENKQVNLVVERHGNSIPRFDVVDGDRTVACVKESWEHNRTWPLMTTGYRKTQPVLDISVAAGADLSLGAAVGVILSDWAYMAYK
ncbi:hypothetical protein N7508_009789 [Penicillium antarcticum]|uniref:uncharacterized protein n=1 Tax=Penicillium antarcticum TaxID=416450 RepID=UPI002390180B|nr:uncharacterized protein N7508_009789 [Penicillium antarcticum]KAJ5294968.1 hypothetical protein N7508_009789 [Penicillium antarcticum]